MGKRELARLLYMPPASLERRTRARNPVHGAVHLVILGHVFLELRFGHADLFRESVAVKSSTA